MSMIKLTPEQINRMDELISDKRAAKESLEVAINYHSNKLALLAKNAKKFWDEMELIYTLDPDITYKVTNRNGIATIVPVDDSDEDS